MVPRKQILMLMLCSGVMAAVHAYADPTTAPAEMAKNYLRRASDEIALIDSQDERHMVLTDWIYARAAFDGPGDVDETIRPSIQMRNRTQKLTLPLHQKQTCAAFYYASWPTYTPATAIFPARIRHWPGQTWQSRISQRRMIGGARRNWSGLPKCERESAT
jgi:hypothetical protein